MPHYLSIGVSKQEFMESCPKDLEPYDSAHKLSEKRIDAHMWTMGLYMQSAMASILSSKHSYEKKPFSFASGKDLSDTDLQKQRELFVAKLEAMGANFNLQKRMKENENKNSG